jgi:hypothetical protein
LEAQLPRRWWLGLPKLEAQLLRVPLLMLLPPRL